MTTCILQAMNLGNRNRISNFGSIARHLLFRLISSAPIVALIIGLHLDSSASDGKSGLQKGIENEDGSKKRAQAVLRQISEIKGNILTMTCIIEEKEKRPIKKFGVRNIFIKRKVYFKKDEGLLRSEILETSEKSLDEIEIRKMESPLLPNWINYMENIIDGKTVYKNSGRKLLITAYSRIRIIRGPVLEILVDENNLPIRYKLFSQGREAIDYRLTWKKYGDYWFIKKEAIIEDYGWSARKYERLYRDVDINSAIAIDMHSGK